MSQIIEGPMVPKDDNLPTKEFGPLTFSYEKKSSLYDTKTYVILKQVSDKNVSASPFTVTCGASGISFSGDLASPLGSMNELQAFAQLVSFAWEEHMKLAPKFNESLTGH